MGVSRGTVVCVVLALGGLTARESREISSRLPSPELLFHLRGRVTPEMVLINVQFPCFVMLIRNRCVSK